MKRLLAVPMILGALLLSACAAMGGAGLAIDAISAVAQVAGRPADPSTHTAAAVPAKAGGVADQVVMRGTQGLIVANNAYQGAAAIAEGYVRSGRATRPQLARIRELNDRAISLLERGEGGLTAAQRAAEVLNIVAELNLFGGRR